MTRAYGAWTASTHGYAVNHLGQRTLHQQDLKRFGNWNSNLYDRRADRTYDYNDRGELATATSTYPNGFAPDAFLYQPVSETENYTYDAIGNRKTATIPKRPVVPTNPTNLAGEFGFGVLPGGTGESVTYGEASNANTYTTITKTNTNNPSNTGGTLTVTHKHDADGNLTDDGEFLYKYDPENRLIAVDPKVLQSGDGEAGFRYAYDHLHRRIRRQVVWWCGAWPLPTQEISHFVYRGWNLALHIHQDYMCYNDTVGTVVGLDMGNYANGLSSRRTDRYVWGRDVSGSLQGAGGVGGLLMAVANPKHSVLWVADAMLPSMAYYFLYDGNGNVSETIHERGAVIGQYRYDGFGKLMGQNATHYVTATDQIVSGINQPFKFSTKWHDDTNHNSASYGPYHRSRSLVYYGYRTYSPDMGRWLGRDPIEEEGGLNLFGMVGNDAVGGIDRLGLQMRFVMHKIPIEMIIRETSTYGYIGFNPSNSCCCYIRWWKSEKVLKYQEKFIFYLPGPKERVAEALKAGADNVVENKLDDMGKDILSDSLGGGIKGEALKAAYDFLKGATEKTFENSGDFPTHEVPENAQVTKEVIGLQVKELTQRLASRVTVEPCLYLRGASQDCPRQVPDSNREKPWTELEEKEARVLDSFFK
jgi:RHS repeat-associated protein